MGDLSRRFSPSWRGWPASMPYGDRQVWAGFLESGPREWDAYSYDVELHGGPAPIVSEDRTMQRTWARLVAKRVDVVAWRAEVPTLMEVRHQASWQSVGQLIGYRDLWPLDFPHLPLAGAAIVTDAIDPQIRAVAERQGLRVIVVAP